MFTMTFVARGQAGCNAPISQQLRNNSLSYAQRILLDSDFGGQYVITPEDPAQLRCQCLVSTENWVRCLRGCWGAAARVCCFWEGGDGCCCVRGRQDA
jgi:hypothetical protein